MAGRGDGRATDALLPQHWRDVREWSVEKRQSHRHPAACHQHRHMPLLKPLTSLHQRGLPPSFSLTQQQMWVADVEAVLRSMERQLNASLEKYPRTSGVWPERCPPSPLNHSRSLCSRPADLERRLKMV
ncbi:uncharacterized protein AB9W97_015130 isoform 1-T1 [Spinachia spinachia]